MVDMAAIASAAGALKTAYDLSKAAIGAHDAATIRAKVAEMQGEINSALASAITAQMDQMAMLKRVGELEKEITDLKAWETEKKRYELKAISRVAVAYVLKSDATPPEEPHWLCTACYQNGKKSIIGATNVNSRDLTWKCPVCAASYLVGFRDSPRQPWIPPP